MTFFRFPRHNLEMICLKNLQQRVEPPLFPRFYLPDSPKNKIIIEYKRIPKEKGTRNTTRKTTSKKRKEKKMIELYKIKRSIIPIFKSF